MRTRKLSFVSIAPNPTVTSRQISNSNLNSNQKFPPSSLNHLKRIHAKLLRSGEILDTLAAGKLISDIVASGATNLGYARSLFAWIQPPLNTFMWNSLIRGYAHGGDPCEAIALYCQMLADGYVPNNYTFPFVLKACTRIADPRVGLGVHGTLIRHGFEDFDPFIQTSLVNFYASCGCIVVAQKLFDRSPQRDVTSWNALIKAYIGCCRYSDAIRVFRMMQDGSNARADEITMLGVISACAHLGALDMGKWVHAYVDRCCMRLTTNLGTALINMYARCGEIETASSLFDNMKEKDVRAWSVMISGLALNGLAKEALDLFAEMQNAGVKPDSVTITGVLSACSHAGYVQKGMKLLDEMQELYFVEPTIEHYGCVVDLLGRAGELEKALALIKRMRLKPDVMIWGAMLVACRVHKNVEIGEMAAKEMLELDSQNAGALVFLSNVYAAIGKWDMVEQVRCLMKEQRIRKPPGSSSIELDGVVHEFLSGDTLHPQSDQIYRMLDEILRLAVLRGYRPVIGGVPFDINEEDKEVCISQHSEKLALAFGLINSEGGTVIRIVKNLRICEDCHSVMQLVSELFNRIVIVRDRNRFHHYKDGACSCKNYW
ncbi:pentatricopeptide repeat-containing protein At4g21065-like isoform X1 [Dioscorea cayenensis subsp. rotundata]|uniref:Pentatricopeptide repeat-containing protein At4g21065-like isoform X1 n=1 Tax=Dioscorea cayennensis subsp. rotundata TaxID=55577 RepID=A0AB40BDI1_DIOCR|nr:pentatricopeptide repeat-containing protein At4g21065-like isoform X1 [Dioscorea cayenensis subsp. rotundata]